jgi:hypothetical protein
MKTRSYEGLAYAINHLTWQWLKDFLDQTHLNKIVARLRKLRDIKEHAIDNVFRALALNPASFDQTQAADVDQAIRARVTNLGGPGHLTFADGLLDRRGSLLNAIALFALRDLGTHMREFRVLLDDLATRLPARAPDLLSFSWNAFYDDLLCSRLESGRYRLLLTTLPDMVDPNLSAERRTALFDTLRRRDAELRAMQDFVTVMGTVQQRTDVERFMDGMRVFLDTFTPAPPTPNILQTIAAFFNSVASEINGLRLDVVNAAQGMIDSLTLGHLTGSEEDDKSREVVGLLSDRVSVLPFQFKAAMIRMMEEGNCADDDERAILEVLTHSKARSIAEFAQLIDAQGWGSLDFSLDWEEHDRLMQLFSKF